MSLRSCQTPRLVKDHSRRAELVRKPLLPTLPPVIGLRDPFSLLLLKLHFGEIV
jgi:hypothetical protein